MIVIASYVEFIEFKNSAFPSIVRFLMKLSIRLATRLQLRDVLEEKMKSAHVAFSVQVSVEK